MARLDARQKADKKRNGGNFKPRGVKGNGHGSEKTPGVHRNKYAEFSKAAGAMAALEVRKELDRKREERAERERRMGWRRG